MKRQTKSGILPKTCQTAKNVADSRKCSRQPKMQHTAKNVADSQKCGRQTKIWQTANNVADKKWQTKIGRQKEADNKW